MGTPLLQQAVPWGLLLGAVTVLTVLFSFLGTITCAVLGGMMFGTMRHRRGRVALVSLTFPAVVLALLHFSQADLVLRKRLLTAALCFGGFWVTYGLSRLVMLLEGRPQPDTVNPSEPTPRLSAEAGAAGAIPAEVPGDESRGQGFPGRLGEVALSDFQGRWWCDLPAGASPVRRRRIDIAGDRFELGVLNGDGQVHILARGEIKLERSGGSRLVTIATGTAGSRRERHSTPV